MKRFTEIISGSAVMIFHVALTGWMFCLSEVNHDFTFMSLNYLYLSAVLLLAYYIDRILLSHSVPVPIYVGVQIVFVAAGIYVFVKSAAIEPFQISTIVINCIVFVMGFVVAAFVSWYPTNTNGIVMRFDGLAAMLIILLVLDEILLLPAADGAAAMCAVSLVLCLVSAISLKSGQLSGRGSAVQGNPALGRIMLGVAFGIIGILAFAVVLYATSGMKSFSEFCLDVINSCWEAVKTALLFIYAVFEKIMLWLTRFYEPDEMSAGAVEMGGTLVIEPGSEEVGEVPGWIYWFLGALGAALLAYILFKLRHVRVGRMKSRRVVVYDIRRESGLGKALKQLLEKLISAIGYRYKCLRYRRSAPGLLVWCEKHVDTSQRRTADESGERFLRRIAASGPGEEMASALNSLAFLVERSFYSPQPLGVPRELYKTIKHGKFKAEKTDPN